MTGGDLSADQCGLTDHDGDYHNPAFQVQGMSYLGTRDAQATSNQGDAFRIDSGSYFESWSDCLDPSGGRECTGSVRNTATDNLGWTVNVHDRSFARLPGLLASRNGYGMNAGTMSGLDINLAEISITASGPAMSAYGMCWVNADNVTSSGSLGGMICSGSYCSARDASVAVVNDGSSECDLNGSCQCIGPNYQDCPEFGFSANQGAFFDINGAEVTGSYDLQYAPNPTNIDGTRLLKY